MTQALKAAAALEVVATGRFASIQDLGRPGWFRAGIGASGAADQPSLRLANRLVGNPESAAAIECLLGGLVLRATGTAIVAVTGAPAAASVDGIPIGHASAITLTTGQTLTLGRAPTGLRVYVAARGGIEVTPVLGSRSLDTLAGIGPPPLTAGMQLPLGPDPGPWPQTDFAPVAPPPRGTITAPVVLGPRADWFTRPSDLFVGHWLVTDRCDRVGARLARPADQPPLCRTDDRELPTEGMPLGAIQVPPSGEPVVFLADHPITGGYPVVGVILSAAIGQLAQARPGQPLRFVPVH